MKLIKKYAIFALLLMISVQLPICAVDEGSITKDLSTIATNIAELTVMLAKGLVGCGQMAIGLTRDLTGFAKDHPAITCTLGLSAYAAWRLMKYKYGDRIYCTLRGVPPHAYYYCSACGHIGDAPYNIVH